MLKILSILLFTFLYINTLAQNNVGIGTLTPNPNAALEIQSTDKGLLIPRLTTVQRNTLGTGLANTENSMLVYDVNDSVFYYWKSTVWIPIPGTSTDNQILTIVGDSLQISNGNSVLFIDNDTTNETIDSVTYLNDTLTIYEGDSAYKTEIIGGEWADADKIGNAGYIYAKQALNNGTADTVVISDNGFLGIGTSTPNFPLAIVDLTSANNVLGGIRVDGRTSSSNPTTTYQSFKGAGGTIGLHVGVLSENRAPNLSYLGEPSQSFLYSYVNSDGLNIISNNDSINFYTTDANDFPTMTMLQNKNVGISTAAPAVKLDVAGDVSVGKHYDYVNTGGAVVNGTYGNKLYFSGVAHNSDNLYFSKYNVSGDVSELRLMVGDNEGAVNNDAFVIGSANSSPAPAGHPWLDYFRVQSNGFVSIGNIPTTYPKARLHVTTAGNNLSDYTALFVNSPGVAGGSGVVFTNTESATATGFKFHAENTGTFTYANDNLKLSSITVATGAVNQNNILNITGDGNVGIGVAPTQRLTVFNGTTTGTYTTTGWIHSSDARLKTNVQPIESAMKIVNKLDGVYYNWKYGDEEKRQIGFLAQEVQKVLPEVVVGEEGDIEKGETLGMAYQNIVPVLVEAIKEQQKEIEKLKAQESKEIQELKAELEEIKKLLLAK